MKDCPYTTACDFIRLAGGHDQSGSLKLTRSDASNIISKVAESLNMKDEIFALKLKNACDSKSDHEKEKEAQASAREVSCIL